MGLEGKLTDMPMHDLLRVFQRSTRSGKLVLWTATELGLLLLLDGQVVSAVVLSRADQHPLCSGEHAVFRLFTWPDGHFRYSPDSDRDSYPITIVRPTSVLIVEALRRRAGEPGLAPRPTLTLQSSLRVLPRAAGADDQMRLSVEEWTVLHGIGQQATAQQVATRTGVSPEQVLQIVAHLVDWGLVVPIVPASLPQRRLAVDLPAPTPGEPGAPITNLTRAIRRRLSQLAVGA